MRTICFLDFLGPELPLVAEGELLTEGTSWIAVALYV